MATVRHLGLLPWCIASSSVLPDVTNPAGVSLDTLLKWYWRVKTWSVSASVTSSNPFTPGTVTYSQTIAANTLKEGSFSISLPQNEKDLVCRRRTYFNEIVNLVGVFNFELLDDAQYYQELYYPFINIGFDGGNQAVIQSLGNNPGGTITMDGISLPSFFLGDATDGFIDLTPSEYWPYDPGDGGGPIYDSTTGAQLRAFP